MPFCFLIIHGEWGLEMEFEKGKREKKKKMQEEKKDAQHRECLSIMVLLVSLLFSVSSRDSDSGRDKWK